MHGVLAAVERGFDAVPRYFAPALHLRRALETISKAAHGAVRPSFSKGDFGGRSMRCALSCGFAAHREAMDRHSDRYKLLA